MKKSTHQSNAKNTIDRRKFFRDTGTIASGIALGSLLPSCVSPPSPEDTANEGLPSRQKGALGTLQGYNPAVSSLWIPRGKKDQYFDRFKQMIASVTDFSWLKSGDKVLLKIALNSGLAFPSTTDPWLLQCMIKLLNEKGANVIVGDQSGSEYVVWTRTSKSGSTRTLMQNSGLYDTITQNGATASCFEEMIDVRGYDNAYVPAFPSGAHHWTHPPYVTSVINDVDHIIYLPRVGSHIIASSSFGMKIGIGFLRDDSRLDMHQGGSNFYAMYEEISDLPIIQSKLRMIASSGRKVLRTDGPDVGVTVEPSYGLVFASTDLLAHDLLAFAWLEANSHKRSYLLPVTPTQANLALNSVCFSGVDGYGDPSPPIPEFTAGNIYNHPAIQNFLARKGGYPSSVQWSQLTPNPNSAIVAKMAAMIDPANAT
jgi:uncharacterized protein (DUF362 family)